MFMSAWSETCPSCNTNKISFLISWLGFSEEPEAWGSIVLSTSDSQLCLKIFLILSCVDKLRNKRWMEFYPLVPVILGFNSKPVDMKGSNSNKCRCGLPTCYLHMVKCPSSVTNFHRIVMGFRSCSQGKLLLASACTVEIVLLMLGKSSTSWCGLTSYWHLFLPHVVDVQNMKIKQTKNQTKRQTVTNFCW